MISYLYTPSIYWYGYLNLHFQPKHFPWFFWLMILSIPMGMSNIHLKLSMLLCLKLIWFLLSFSHRRLHINQGTQGKNLGDTVFLKFLHSTQQQPMSSSFKIYTELVHFSPLLTQFMSASHCHVLLRLLQQSFNCSFCFCSFPQNNSVKMRVRHVTPLLNVKAYEVKSFQCYSIGHFWPHLLATSYWLTLLQTQWYSFCSSNTMRYTPFSF